MNHTGQRLQGAAVTAAGERGTPAEKMGGDAAPRVWIILLNWDGLSDTRECLDSLKGITYDNYRVMVVDNASVGNDVEILREEYGPYIHLVQNDKNYGFAEGNNIGIRWILARGTDYIMLLNNDTVVDPSFLTALVEVAHADPLIGVVGSKIYYLDEPAKLWSAGGIVNWSKGTVGVIGEDEPDSPAHGTTVDVDWVSGCALMVKAAVLEQISLLDPFFYLRGEDVEFCIRAKRAGYRVLYVPSSKVWHKVGAAGERVEARKTLNEVRRMGIHDINLLRGVFWRYASKPQLGCAVIYYLLVTLPRWLRDFFSSHGGLSSTLRFAARSVQRLLMEAGSP